MKQTIRRLLPWGVAAFAVGGALFFVPKAQTQLVAQPPQAYAQLVEQLKKQQEQMSANQGKIDEQLATLKEELRLLKIYSKRAGGAGAGKLIPVPQ